MGAFLATPKTEKHSEFGGTKDDMTSEYGASAMQGWRQTMEDAHVAIPSLRALVENAQTPPATEFAGAFSVLQAMGMEDIGIYGVFDGHGSNAVSQWTAANLLSIFSERVLAIRAEMQATKATWPKGASRAGPSIDSDLLTPENAVLCQAMEDAFLAVDEKIKTPESRQALVKIFQDGQREQHGSETYLEWFLKNGGDARVIDMNGQRYIQLLVGSDEAGEGGDEPSGGESRLEDVDAQERPAGSEDVNGQAPMEVEEEPQSPSVCTTGETAAAAAESPKTDALRRLDSTNVAAAPYGRPKPSATSSEAGSTPRPAQAGESPPPPEQVKIQDQQQRLQQQDQEHSAEVAERESEATPAGSESGDQVESSPTPTTTGGPGEDTDSRESDGNSGDESRSSDVDKASKDKGDLCSPADAQRNEHPHPSSPEGSGATSVVVIVVRGPNPVLIVANAGDSRGVISRGGVAFPLSHDHKPMNPGERARIVAAGGSVTNGRVDGNLNLSRSLGDLYYKADSRIPPEKQRITAFPDIRVTPICKDDEFVIIACDGIWDCKTNQEAVDFVRAHIGQSKKPSAEMLRDACEALCDDCLSHDPIKSEGHGCDNMTVVIVDLATKLRQEDSASAKIVLYGGGEDLYLGRDEAEFEADDEDD